MQPELFNSLYQPNVSPDTTKHPIVLKLASYLRGKKKYYRWINNRLHHHHYLIWGEVVSNSFPITYINVVDLSTGHRFALCANTFPLFIKKFHKHININL